MATATQAIPGVNSIMGIASHLGEPDDNTAKAAPAISKLPANKAIAAPQTNKAQPSADNSRIEQLLESINVALGKGMNLSFANYLDGKEISSRLVSPYGQGTTGINTGASLLSPGMSSFGLG
jgi:predicted DNA-binding transcriptional regulator YafY